MTSHDCVGLFAMQLFPSHILLTCDLQGNCVLLVIDAHHDLTAVQTGVAGT